MDTRYLNHAGTSWPKPASVHAAVQEAATADPATWGERFAAAHAAVARQLSVPPAALLPTPSCTSALAVAVADVPWQPGDRVVTSSMEHHALWRPLAKLAAAGVEVVEVPRGPDGPLDLAAVQAALQAGGVRLVAASMASNVTGEALPWAELVGLAHAHGALCLLDGAQVAGWLSLDLTELQVDLFAFAGHKGPQGPTGVGGLYVRPGVPLSTPEASCDGEVCRTGPGYCDTGSVSLPALAGLAAGWQWMAERAPRDRALGLARQLRRELAARPEVEVVGHPPVVPTVSFLVAGMAPASVAARWAEVGVVVRGGTQCAPRAHRALGTGEAGTVRVSFGPTSDDADLDRVLACIAELLDR